MTAADRLGLARVLIRVSLALPKEHPAHVAIDAAVEALMAKTATQPTQRLRA